MQVITAVEPILNIHPSVFLAGGITNCPWWQDELRELLKNEEGVIYNPRRRNFPMDDPNAAKEQIKWEFDALAAADIFSMWFSDADSDQPICMYELGRHVALRTMWPHTIIIGVEPGYRRSQDVYVQMELINPKIKISNNLEQHAENIKKSLKSH